jgi:hypothetical protein
MVLPTAVEWTAVFQREGGAPTILP